MACGLLGAVYNAGMIRLLRWQDRARWLPGPVRIVFPFACCGVLELADRRMYEDKQPQKRNVRAN